jgi:hypothetical protein
MAALVKKSEKGPAPVKIRTSNLLIRSQMLYPVELRAQNPIFFGATPPRGGPYYIRFEPPSTAGNIHRSFR